MGGYPVLSGTDGGLSVAALLLALLALARARLAVPGFLLCVALKALVTLLLLLNFGWLLAADEVIVGCPVVLGPAIVLGTRKTLAPRLAAVVGAAADVRFAFFAAPQPPYAGSLLVVAAVGAVVVLAGLVATRWIAQGSRTRIAVVVVLGATPLVGGFALSARTSVLPSSYGMNMAGAGTSVAALTGPAGVPDVRFTLTASTGRVKVGGLEQDALTFNGTAPGPELRVKLGQLVEVTLVNKDVVAGVTVHWHGLNVPNAEDGVAGVTQDAVRPGQRLVYRFRPAQLGTFWYHSHQDSRAEVGKGLYGALIVDPPAPVPALDVAAIAHSWPDVNVLNTSTVDRRRAAPGQLVRVRLIDTDSWPVRFAVSGTPFRVAAIDGSAVHGPGEVTQGLLVPAGGRLDVLFTMPAGPVTVTAFADAHNRKSAGRGIADPAMVFSADGRADPASTVEPDTDVDFSAYGTPAPTPFDARSQFAEQETYYIDYGYRFHDGGFGPAYTLNGELFPRTPMLMVREGDLAELTFVNRSADDHAMHLHGHTMLVLARDGRAVSGSPWWTDTLNVAPGETYTVAFRADNPGVWMDHCHNFGHAAGGMTMHLAYLGVTDPYRAGAATGNDPE